MKKQSSTILYLFIILIIISGIFLFIFKDRVAENLLTYSVIPVVSKKSNNDLKLDILRDPRIKELKSYVSVFNYESLEKSQELILENYNTGGDVIISNPESEGVASSTKKTENSQIIRVRVGNSNPFLTKKAPK